MLLSCAKVRNPQPIPLCLTWQWVGLEEAKCNMREVGEGLPVRRPIDRIAGRHDLLAVHFQRHDLRMSRPGPRNFTTGPRTRSQSARSSGSTDGCILEILVTEKLQAEGRLGIT